MIEIQLDSPAGRELVDMLTNASTYKISLAIRQDTGFGPGLLAPGPGQLAVKRNEGMWTAPLSAASDGHGTFQPISADSHVQRIDLRVCICDDGVVDPCPIHDPSPERDPESLGSCGCVDYHMADCPTRTGYADSLAAREFDFDEYYGEDN